MKLMAIIVSSKDCGNEAGLTPQVGKPGERPPPLGPVTDIQNRGGGAPRGRTVYACMPRP